MARIKTDNHNPAAKLDLRRYMLRRYHHNQFSVLDCCNGSGKLWSELRKEFPIASLVGIDVKPKKGRIKTDSARLLDQPGWPQEVIDVDTYGSPWEHFASIVKHLDRPRTVFLTWGIVTTGGGSAMPNIVARSLGLSGMKIPSSMTLELCKVALPYLLTGTEVTCRIIEAVEALSDGNARYLAIRLEPKKEPALREQDRPKHAKL